MDRVLLVGQSFEQLLMNASKPSIAEHTDHIATLGLSGNV